MENLSVTVSDGDSLPLSSSLWRHHERWETLRPNGFTLYVLLGAPSVPSLWWGHGLQWGYSDSATPTRRTHLLFQKSTWTVAFLKARSMWITFRDSYCDSEKGRDCLGADARGEQSEISVWGMVLGQAQLQWWLAVLLGHNYSVLWESISYWGHELRSRSRFHI